VISVAAADWLLEQLLTFDAAAEHLEDRMTARRTTMLSRIAQQPVLRPGACQASLLQSAILRQDVILAHISAILAAWISDT
jgi:tRNA C32,U32 (ribose-2'-O)-methylase TrmJ